MSELDLLRGTQLLSERLQQILEEQPELSDIHDAFEEYCANKFSLGSTAPRQKLGGKNDLGIDFYSRFEHSYNIGQCKIPELEWLEAHPGEIKEFGQSALNDTRDALRYLLGKSNLKPSEKVQSLYAWIAEDRNRDDFSLTFFVVVYGRLGKRARDAFGELQAEYSAKPVNIVLKEADILIEEFLVGSAHPTGDVRVELRVDKGSLLRAHNYCYLLANAADIFTAFRDYGWRLFDLNLRYEVRNSPVNADIVRSLAKHKSRKQFHHYNNGLIIICQNYSRLKDDTVIRLQSPQIVNGLQTVKSIYDAVVGKEADFSDLENECLVQVKVITNSDVDFVSKVVQCTNNQNPMSARNLKSNDRLQKTLRTGFQLLSPRWFLQVKEGEWRSLTQEGGRFFEQVVAHKPAEFRVDPRIQKDVRLIDNQEAAKAWLAFMGFADYAGDRVTHFFSEDDVYELAFGKRPTKEYWKRFAETTDFSGEQRVGFEPTQGTAIQYLLAFALWQFVNSFIPTPKGYREQGLNEGVRDGKIKKADGSFLGTTAEHDAYLAGNSTYQTWRLMANMKELLVEAASQLLCQRYGPLESKTCGEILRTFDLKEFPQTCELREIATNAAVAKDFPRGAVVSRVFAMLRYSTGQFWEEKKTLLLSTSRLRTLLVRREMASEFKRVVLSTEERTGLDKGWKPEGTTFLNSLPKLA